mgnify:FL=1
MNRSSIAGPGLLITALAVGVYVMAADFINLRATAPIVRPEPIERLPVPQPWGGYGWRELSRISGDAAVQNPESARATILRAAVRYPLDATQWLDLAQIGARAGTDSEVAVFLDQARASQPQNRRALWRAAQIALQTGDERLAERQLRQWLQLFPSDTGQALFIGRRWIDSPDELLERMLPPGREFLEQAMQVASSRLDTELAEAVWQRLDPKPGLSDAAFLDYVDLLLDTGAVDRATQLWASRDRDYSGSGIVNGSFSREFGTPAGLNWKTDRTPAAVRIAYDTEHATSAPASIRIEFNGKENVRLTRPTIRIPVEPEQRYRLSGMWRAEALTTRSLPFLELRSKDKAIRESVGVPLSNFEWEAWEIIFTTAASTRLVALTLRRNPTDAFDRNIDGLLWIDDVALEPFAAEEHAPEQRIGAGDPDRE